MKFSDRCRPLKHAFLTCVCGVNSLLEIKEERIKVLEGALLELKHQSHHTIAEEMWRIDEALKPYQSKESMADHLIEREYNEGTHTDSQS